MYKLRKLTSLFLSVALAVSMMCGLFVVDAGAAYLYVDDVYFSDLKNVLNTAAGTAELSVTLDVLNNESGKLHLFYSTDADDIEDPESRATKKTVEFTSKTVSFTIPIVTSTATTYYYRYDLIRQNSSDVFSSVHSFSTAPIVWGSSSASNITQTSAKISTVFTLRDSNISSYGVQISTGSFDDAQTLSAKLGMESVNIIAYSEPTGLSAGTTYYYRFYAIFGSIAEYSPVGSFTTSQQTAAVAAPAYAALIQNQYWYDLTDTIKLSPRSDTATYYYLSISYEGKKIVDSVYIPSGSRYSLEASKLGAGVYVAWITACNSSGSIDSEPIDVHVVDTVGYNGIYVGRDAYTLNDTVSITVDPVCAKGQTIGIDKIGEGRKITQDCGTTYTVAASTLGTGLFGTYFTVYNGSAQIDTRWEFFSIDNETSVPENVSLASDKHKYKLNEDITLSPGSTNASVFRLYILKDGTEVFNSKIVEDYTFNSSAFGAGKFEAKISAINSRGSTDYSITYTVFDSQGEEFVIDNGVLIAYDGNGGDVVIPAGVTKIDDYAFEKNTSVTSAAIPAGVTEIGFGAFSDCVNLKVVTFLGDTLKNIGKFAFYKCSFEEFIVPDGTEEIGAFAFSYNETLKKITIPDSVTYLGIQILRKCNGLTDIIFKGTSAQWDKLLDGFELPVYTNEGVTVTCLGDETEKDMLGELEVCEPVDGGIHIKGWTLYTPDTEDDAAVVVYFKNKETSEEYSHLAYLPLMREDINQKYNVTGFHGFDITLSVEEGDYIIRLAVCPYKAGGEYPLAEREVHINSGTADERTDISYAQVEAIPDQTYTGSEIKPAIESVICPIRHLFEGTDYTAEYTNNVNVGTATITLTGIGDFKGTKTVTFNIIDGGGTTDTSKVNFICDVHIDGELKPHTETVQVKSGETVSPVKAPEYDGVVFIGWYTDQTFTAVFDFTKPILADTDIYAKYGVPDVMVNGKSVTDLEAELKDLANTTEEITIELYKDIAVKKLAVPKKAESLIIKGNGHTLTVPSITADCELFISGTRLKTKAGKPANVTTKAGFSGGDLVVGKVKAAWVDLNGEGENESLSITSLTTTSKTEDSQLCAAVVNGKITCAGKITLIDCPQTGAIKAGVLVISNDEDCRTAAGAVTITGIKGQDPGESFIGGTNVAGKINCTGTLEMGGSSVKGAVTLKGNLTMVECGEIKGAVTCKNGYLQIKGYGKTVIGGAVKITGNESEISIAEATIKGSLTGNGIFLYSTKVYGKVSAKGLLTIIDSVTVNGAVSVAGLKADSDEASLSCQSLAVTKNGIAEDSQQLSLILIDRYGEDKPLEKSGNKDTVVIKTFKDSKAAGGKVPDISKLSLGGVNEGKELLFSNNKIVLA